jgi:hypothetical protein
MMSKLRTLDAVSVTTAGYQVRGAYRTAAQVPVTGWVLLYRYALG